MQKTDKTAIICLLARNVEDALTKNLPKIDSLRKFFVQSWVVVVENDSTDRTLEILKSWEKSSEGIFIDSFELKKKENNKTKKSIFPGASAERIDRMAFVRNRYLNFIRNNNLRSDYIIVIDIDLDDFDEKQIITAIEKAPSDWSSIFANGRLYSKIFNRILFTKFYDTYAYVPLNSDTDCLTYREEFLNRDLQVKKYFPCKSAFGGIGIYRYNSIINSNYSTRENNRCSLQEVICEHISVNLDSLKCGKNYICEKLKTYYQRCSVKSSFFPASVIIRLRFLLSKLKGEESVVITALAGSQQSAVSSQQKLCSPK